MRSLIALRTAALTLACGGLFAAGAAFAQSTEPAQATPPPTSSTPPPTGDSASSSTAPKTFKDLDSNADGYVSKDEAVADAKLSKHFAKHDTDGDGKLSETEFGDTSKPADAGKQP